MLAIVGIVGLSIMVWAHHMYASGWAPDLNGPFMLTTELISIPTGVLFLVILGTMWRGRIWTTLPMMSTYAMLWNFIIGGDHRHLPLRRPGRLRRCTARCSSPRTSTTR